MTIDLTPTLICHDGDSLTLPAWKAAEKIATTDDVYGACDDALWHPDRVPTPAPATLLCPAGTWANDALDGCEALPEVAVSPANDQLPAAAPLTVAPVEVPAVPVPVALVAVPPTPVAVLAHTGADPAGWLVAAVMVVVGISMVRVGARHSR